MSELQGIRAEGESPEITRLYEIIALLYGADMSDPANEALRKEAYRILDEVPDRNTAYDAACRRLLMLQRNARAAMDKTVRTPQPTNIDGYKIKQELGRVPSNDEWMAIAIQTNAKSSGRSIEMTVAASELFGEKVSLEVKKILGII